MQATHIDYCTLERSNYLKFTAPPLLESTPYFTSIICSALVSVEETDSVEDAPLRYASLCSWGKMNILACF